MLDAAGDLRPAAIFVGAAPCCFSENAAEGSAADRTFGHKLHGRCVGKAPAEVYAGDLRNDLACLLHIEMVSLVDIELAHDVVVMERRAFHDGSREEHRFQIRHRGDDSHSSGFERYEPQGSARSLGIEFEGHGPSRRFGGEAEVELLAQGVDLEDEAVGGHGELLAVLVPISDELVDIFQSLQAGHRF